MEGGLKRTWARKIQCKNDRLGGAVATPLHMYIIYINNAKHTVASYDYISRKEKRKKLPVIRK